MPAQQTPIRATTQEHLDIEDIRDDLVILKDGSCCLILETTAINFGLLSEPEQDATIYAYAGFLNSLSFPVQIVIRSQRKDISSYLQLLKRAEEKQEESLLKEQIQKYRVFVERIVKENQVLDKNFYIIIPFSSLELGVSSSLSQSFTRKKKLPFPIDYILEKAKITLYPKRDHLISQFGRLGLKARQLKTQEMLDLFYQIYNPEAFGQKIAATKSYNAPLVSPAIKQTTKKEASSVPNQTNEQPTKNQSPAPPKEEPGKKNA